MTRTRWALALVMLAPSAALADGMLDPNFGNGGIVITFVGSGGVARRAVTQPDGKIVVVGNGFNYVSGSSQGDILLARYEPNGSLDPTFGTLGVVGTHIPSQSNHENGTDVALQPDGKIVVSAYKPENQIEAVAVRYLTNGALDPSFGVNGLVRLSIPGDVIAQSIAIRPSGPILLGGASAAPGSSQRMTVVQLQPNGLLDGTFGVGGIATIDASGNGTNAAVFDMELQADGRTVLTGFVNAGAPADQQFATARFTASGLPDGTFGTGGVVRTNVGSLDDVGIGVAVQPDGRVVVGGYTNGSNQETLLVRYTQGGVLDPTFGTGGITSLSLGVQNQARTLVVQPDGKIVTAGLHGFDFMLARFTSTGALDPSFGTNGILVTSLSPGRDEANGMHISSPDRLLVVGQYNDGVAFGVARYASTTPVMLGGFAVE